MYQNNIIMNQILLIKQKQKNKKLIGLFKIQLIVSVILIIIGIVYIINSIGAKEKENKISNIISINAKINTMFSSNQKHLKNNVYFGRIYCSKIGLDYYVYNSYSEEKLKILPCKFYGRIIE